MSALWHAIGMALQPLRAMSGLQLDNQPDTRHDATMNTPH